MAVVIQFCKNVNHRTSESNRVNEVSDGVVLLSVFLLREW